MGKQAEGITSNLKNYSGSDKPVYAYKVLSYLMDHGEIRFVEMRKLLGIGHDGFWYKHLLLYIWDKIMDLAEEWDEDIPPITVLVFDRHGNASPRACAYFGDSETQPTPQQIKEEKASIAVYDKWDKVLDAFRADIPDEE